MNRRNLFKSIAAIITGSMAARVVPDRRPCMRINRVPGFLERVRATHHIKWDGDLSKLGGPQRKRVVDALEKMVYPENKC